MIEKSASWRGEYRSRDRTIHPPAFAPAYKTSIAPLAQEAAAGACRSPFPS